MKNVARTINNKTLLLAIVTIVIGVLAGVYLIQRPVDIRERAAEIDRCQMPIMTCSVNPGDPGTYDDFVLQIIDPLNPDSPLLEGGINVSQIEMPVQPNKIYECHVKSVTDSRCWRKVQGVSPVCVAPSITPTGVPSITPTGMPSATPTSTAPTVTPALPTATPSVPTATPAITTPTPRVTTPTPITATPTVVTPTPSLFPGCPIGIKSIDPILCVINDRGECY